MFTDRADAAYQLLAELQTFQNKPNTVVISLPRGGVVTGAVIAKELHLPMDVALVKKIGHPSNQEYAIGAASLQDRILTRNDIDPEYIESETKKIRNLLWKRHEMYYDHRNPVDLKDKTVILVDDGIATGDTMLASIELIKSQKPRMIIVATPVASIDAYNKISTKVDKIICLETPTYFNYLGMYYREFGEVTDKEVINILHYFPNTN